MKCDACGKEINGRWTENEGKRYHYPACYEVAKEVKELISDIRELKLKVGKLKGRKIKELYPLLIAELEDAIRELKDVLEVMNEICVKKSLS